MSLPLHQIKLSDFHYDLPQERIAQFPLKKRDQSKLLIYNQGEITHTQFFDLPNFISSDSILFFNNTKVINARLFFQRKTGALIQIFLLEPIDPYPIQIALQSQQECVWECMIGNRKKWKQDEILFFSDDETNIQIEASWADYEKSHIRFKWNNPVKPFAELIEDIGKIPLPPYILREASTMDQVQYQTIYSKEKGAVAAPTAGLHFTDEVFSNLAETKIHTDFITLHVGAGTFLPIKSEEVQNHDMHSEEIIITQDNIERLLQFENQVIAVGTTSMRVLESLYWHALNVYLNDESINEFLVPKLFPYQFETESLPSCQEVFSYLLSKMREENKSVIHGRTEIFIFPGYTFQVCKGLITNYHMPKSTLILLIAAFVGEDWRIIYEEALNNDYRFLSYGDSSLLLPTFSF